MWLTCCSVKTIADKTAETHLAMIADVCRDYTELKHAGKSASQRYHTIYGHSSSLGHRIQAEIEHGHYFPVVDKGTRACAGRLPWWQQNHLLWQSKQFRHWLAQSQPAR